MTEDHSIQLVFGLKSFGDFFSRNVPAQMYETGTENAHTLQDSTAEREDTRGVCKGVWHGGKPGGEPSVTEARKEVFLRCKVDIGSWTLLGTHDQPRSSS